MQKESISCKEHLVRTKEQRPRTHKIVFKTYKRALRLFGAASLGTLEDLWRYKDENT